MSDPLGEIDTALQAGRDSFLARLQLWRWDAETPPNTEPIGEAEAAKHEMSAEEVADYNAHFDKAELAAEHERTVARVAFCDYLLVTEEERDAARADLKRYRQALAPDALRAHAIQIAYERIYPELSWADASLTGREEAASELRARDVFKAVAALLAAGVPEAEK